MQLKLINVVRDRENVDELKAELRQIGAEQIFTEDEVSFAIIIL